MCDHLSSKRLSPISDRLSKTSKLPSQSLTVGSPSKRPPPVRDRDHFLGMTVNDFPLSLRNSPDKNDSNNDNEDVGMQKRC